MSVALKGQNPVPLPGLNRWRKAPETTASVTSAGPGGLLGQLLGELPAPKAAAPAARRSNDPRRDDRNFIEKLFGLGD